MQNCKVPPTHQASTNADKVTEFIESRDCESTNVAGRREYQFEDAVRNFSVSLSIFPCDFEMILKKRIMCPQE